MHQVDPLAEVLEHLHRLEAAAHGPEGIQLQAHIVRIRVLHDVVQDGLALEGAVFLVVIVIEVSHAQLVQALAGGVEDLDLLHEIIISGEAAHGIDDVLVAQNLLVLHDLVKVRLLNGEDVGGDDPGAVLVKLCLHILGSQAKAAAVVHDGVVIADLNILIAQLGDSFHGAQGILRHQIANRIKDQANFNHFRFLLNIFSRIGGLFWFHCNSFFEITQPEKQRKSGQNRQGICHFSSLPLIFKSAGP